MVTFYTLLTSLFCILMYPHVFFSSEQTVLMYIFAVKFPNNKCRIDNVMFGHEKGEKYLKNVKKKIIIMIR
jgi:hypothetical protein